MNITEIAGLLASLGSLLGAFVLWRKSRPEANKLKAESAKIMADRFSAEVAAIRENYDRMLKTQLESIVKPMEHRIDRLNKLVKELQDEVDELKSYRSRFDISILYIRSLCHWADNVLSQITQLNGEIKLQSKPKLPPELRAYFELKKGIKNEN